MCVRYAGVCVCVCDDGQSHFRFGKTTHPHLTHSPTHNHLPPPTKSGYGGQSPYLVYVNRAADKPKSPGIFLR